MPELTICGFGLSLLHMTLETLEAVKASEIVFTDALDAASSNSIRRLCRDVRDLNVLCSGGPPEEVCARKVRLVLSCVEKGQRVAVLNYGHSTFLSSLAHELICECKARGIGYRVLNSVSSLDGVLTALDMTLLWGGLHIYDADNFSGLIAATALEPEVPTLIVKVGYLLKREQQGRLRAFLEYLGRFYPAGHPVTLVECACISNRTGDKRVVPLRQLGEVLLGPNEFNTLFIPAVSGAEAWKLAAPSDYEWEEAEEGAREPAGRLAQLRAEEKLLRRDFRGALEDLEQAEAWGQRLEWTFALRAAVFLMDGDWNNAALWLDSSLAKDSGPKAVFRLWSLFAGAPDDVHARIAARSEALERELPGRFWVPLMSGMTWLRLSEGARAAAALRRAADLAGDCPFAHLNLGAALLKCGQPQAAIAPLDRALELDGAHPWGLALRGEAYCGFGEQDKGRMDFERALDLDGQGLLARCWRGGAHFSYFMRWKRLGTNKAAVAA